MTDSPRHPHVLLMLGVLLLMGPAARPAAAQVEYDTVAVQTVGPGMVHRRIVAPAVPWSIDVLEIDLKNPYLRLETVKSNDLRAGGRETTSSMAARRNAPGHWAVGAINADFFNLGSGETTGLQITAGEVVHREAPDHPAIGFTPDNRATLARAVVGGMVRARGASLTINGYNEARATDQIILYNRYIGARTGTNAAGTEARIRPLTAWTTNDTLRAVVEAVENGVGNMSLAAGQAVLSGHGTAAAFLQANVRVGDTLKVFQRVSPGLRGITEMVGGNPLLVRNGAPLGLSNSAFDVGRNPRTAVGFNADTTRLYFVTVDGRQASSAGMSNYELRDFLLVLGVAQGFNLDGGGSTTMVVRGRIVNAPSDSGVERPVANALVAISTAPLGPVALLQATPTYTKLFIGRTVQLRVTASDAFFNPIALDPARLVYRVDARLGSISATGLFTAGTEAAEGYVRVSTDGRSDSVRVVVKGVGRLALTPARALTDTSRVVQLRARAYDTDGIEQSVPAAAVTYRVTDASVGAVTPTGAFRGRAAGTTLVIASYAPGIADTASVAVELPTGPRVLDPLDAVDGWRLTGANVDTAATRLTSAEASGASGGRAFRVHYRFTQTQNAVGLVYLNTDLPVGGVPDSINFRLRSDGANHRAFLDFTDDTGAAFTVGVPRLANDSTAFAYMPGALVRATLPFETLVFPIRLTRVRIQLGYKGGVVAGKVYEGDLYLDQIRVTYPATATAAAPSEAVPTAFAFGPSRPNPFRGATTVSFEVSRAQAVHLVLYDALGRAVATVYDGVVGPGEHRVRVDASGLPAGLYYLRPTTAGAVRPLALVLLR